MFCCLVSRTGYSNSHCCVRETALNASSVSKAELPVGSGEWDDWDDWDEEEEGNRGVLSHGMLTA